MLNHLISRRRLTLGMAGFAALNAQVKDTPGIGVIGLGNRSRQHFAAMAELPEAKVVALCDLDSKRIAAKNDGLSRKATPYTDYRELLRDPNVGMVVIATPNFTHHDIAIAALRAGKDVILEKPIAISYAQAREIQAEAKRNGRILGIGMQRVFQSDHQMIEALRQGLVGKIKLITCAEFRGDWAPGGFVYHDPVSGKSANWRFLRASAGSSELEFSVHLFGTLMRFIDSPLRRLSATGGTLFYTNRDTRDTSSAVAEFANRIRLSYTYGMFAKQDSYLIVMGDQGSLRRDGRSKLSASTLNGKPKPMPDIPMPEGADLILLYRDFFDAVRSRRQPKVSANEAIEAAKLAYAMDISIAENRVVTEKEFA